MKWIIAVCGYFVCTTTFAQETNIQCIGYQDEKTISILIQSNEEKKETPFFEPFHVAITIN